MLSNNIANLQKQKKEFDNKIKDIKAEEAKLITNIEKIKEKLGIKGMDSITTKISEFDS